MPDLDEEVSGGVQGNAARPEPAGLLDAQAEALGQGRICPAQWPRPARYQLPLCCRALLLVLQAQAQAVVQHISRHHHHGQCTICTRHLQTGHRGSLQSSHSFKCQSPIGMLNLDGGSGKTCSCASHWLYSCFQTCQPEDLWTCHTTGGSAGELC